MLIKQIINTLKKYSKNMFVLSLVVFAIWMLFFDANSWLIHHELNTDIKNLENEKKYYQKEIEKDKKIISELSTEYGIEKLARETYFMKKEDEDIFIIEYKDSISKQKSR